MKRTLLPLFALLMVVSLALPALADKTSTRFRLSEPVSLAGTQLNAGEYTLEVENGQAIIKRNGNVVAEVACEVKENGTKFSRTSVLISEGKVKEIRIGGKRMAVVFP
jgi:hypothetical protein